MKFRKAILLAVLGMMVSCCVIADSTLVTKAEITSDSIKEKQKQIKQAEEEKKKLQSGLTDVKKMKQELEKTKKDLQNYIVTLDGDLEVVNAKIAELQEQVDATNAMLEETTEELNQAIAVETEQYESMKTRIQFMYERGDNFYLEAILNADNFSDILNRADYFEELAAYDRKKLDEYVENRQLIEACKEEIEAEKALLDEAKAAQEAEQANLEELISAKSAQVSAYESDIKDKDAAIKDYEDELSAMSTVISQLEAAVMEEKRAIAAANGVSLSYDGGTFQWPAPSYTRVSSDFGYRVHPTLGVQLYHNGVDLASPNGTKILAAYDGIVVAADYTSVMGNYIMLDHGDGLYTVYMHASALHVSKGDIVIKGEHIANVGSTGRSTGPHLHFSVRLNGEYVSPWNYISK